MRVFALTVRAPAVRRSLTVSLAAALLLGVLSTLPSVAGSTVEIATIPAASSVTWLDRLNAWRATTGLSNLSENTTWSAGDVLHSTYMVKDDLVTHFETPGAANYTTAGDAAARNSNIQVSSSTSATDVQAIDWWMQAPFHAMGMMDPRLTSTGFGAYRQVKSGWQAGFAIDVLRGNSFTGGSYPVVFPGNGATEPLTAYGGGEFPDPLQGCSGYTAPTGLPVFIQIGGNVVTKVGAVHSFTGNGVALAHCVIDGNNAKLGSDLYARGGAILIPRSPLKTGVHYVVSLTVNNVPRTWSFTVGPLVTTPARPSGTVATGGDATATVTWSAPAFDGGAAITSYTVTPYIGSVAQASQIVVAPTTTATFNGLTDGTTYWFKVAATNSAGTGVATSSYSVTPTSTATPPARMTATSRQQRQLPNSDGATWQDLDAANLSLSVTPSVDSLAIVSANADLWTANTGYNQDLGIWMSPSTAPAGIVAWKESGGFAGTFSPNAAAVQTVVALTANITYSLKLRWKTNRPALGASIFAAAGSLPAGGGNSPTRLTVQLVPAGSVSTVVTNKQYSLANSDGATWLPIDNTGLSTAFTPTADSMAVLSANADLWTSSAGFNQDIGLLLSGGAYGSGRLVAWKESGGFAGTFSPNAAFVQTAEPVAATVTYTIKLVWKTNRTALGKTIYAGAGPLPTSGQISPIRLTAYLMPANSVATAARNQQYQLPSSDGATWQSIDSTNLRLNVMPATSGNYIVSANADLWTVNAGYNQDLAIFISGGAYGSGQLVAWEESGGFAGTFSPNAAYVESVLALAGGTTYTIDVRWKTNRPATGATIYAGAGPLPLNSAGGGMAGQISPTRLTALRLG